MPRISHASVAALLAATTVLSGCAHGPIEVVTQERPAGDPRCASAAGQPSALISEWSPAQKAELEQAVRGGGVAVEYHGCELRVLPQCRAGGSYAWQSANPAQATVEIGSEQALFEKLPLSADALQEDLRRARTLRIATQITGELRLQQVTAKQVPFAGDCQYATHLVTAIALGTSSLTGGDGQAVRPADTSCAQAPKGGSEPSCGGPLQLWLARLPNRGTGETPPGMVQLDVVSSSDDRVWEAYSNGTHLCTTPCTQLVDPWQPISLKARGWPNDQILVPSLSADVMEARNGMLLATGSHKGKFVNGVVFTTLGGMGIVVGITFTAVGCGDPERRPGVCSAGLITGAASIPVTAFALWLLLDSFARADLLPVVRTKEGPGKSSLTLGVGPTGIAGTF